MCYHNTLVHVHVLAGPFWPVRHEPYFVRDYTLKSFKHIHVIFTLACIFEAQVSAQTIDSI